MWFFGGVEMKKNNKSPYMTKFVNKIINSQLFIFLMRFPSQTKFKAIVYVVNLE